MPLRDHVDIEKVAGRIIKYVQYVLIAVLAVTCVLAIASAVSSYKDSDTVVRIAIIVSVALCCVTLVILECISMYLVRAFKIKMVFFAAECLIMVALGVLTGSALVVVLFCVVLTECYMNLAKQIDKLIMFICACAFYIISYVIGWVIVNVGASVFDSIVTILSGCLYGLLAMLIDYVIVDFLMYLYKKNRELNRALKEAEESKAALREAYSKLAETSVYEERNRIARDIHDNAGHSITSVIMQTEAAKVNMDTDPEQAKRSIIAANIQAKNALEQMRASVHLLAGRTDDLALKTEIEGVIMETADGTDIKIRSDLDNITVPEPVFRYVSNTVKECLANGLRHGGATAFYIEMKQEGRTLHLLISDNGSGIPAGAIQEGYGLKGMREQAARLGGSCTFTTDGDDGFETTILLPLSAETAVEPSAEAQAETRAEARVVSPYAAAATGQEAAASAKASAQKASAQAKADAESAAAGAKASSGKASAGAKARAEADMAPIKAAIAAYKQAKAEDTGEKPFKAAAKAYKQAKGGEPAPQDESAVGRAPAGAAANEDESADASEAQPSGPEATETLDVTYSASAETGNADGTYAVSETRTEAEGKTETEEE